MHEGTHKCMNKCSSQELFRRLALGCWYSIALNVSESALMQASCVNPNQLQHEEVSSTHITHALLDNSQLSATIGVCCRCYQMLQHRKLTPVEAKTVGN